MATTSLQVRSTVRVDLCTFFFVCILLGGKLASSQSQTSCSPEIECVASVYENDSCKLSALPETYQNLYRNEDGATPTEPQTFSWSLFDRAWKSTSRVFQGVNFTFTASIGNNRQLTKGFELTVNRFELGAAGSPVSTFCVVFNLSAELWTRGYHNQAVISHVIYPLYPKSYYVAEVDSLPKPLQISGQYQRVSFVTKREHTDQSLAMYWIAEIHLIIVESNVKLEFSQPPERFGFKEFRVTLVNTEKSEPELVRKETITEFSHEFRDIPMGRYQIWILPIDEFKYDDKNCICRQDEVCALCQETKTTNFNVPLAVTTPQLTTVSNEHPVTVNKLSSTTTASTPSSVSGHGRVDTTKQKPTTTSSSFQSSVLGHVDTTKQKPTTTSSSFQSSVSARHPGTTTIFNTTSTAFHPPAYPVSADNRLETTGHSSPITESFSRPSQGYPPNTTKMDESVDRKTVEDDVTVKAVLASVFSVIGLLVAALLVLYFCRRVKFANYYSHKTDKKKTKDIVLPPQKKKPTLTRKTVYLVYFQDHECHVKAVERLAVYLQKVCLCDVIYAPWYLSKIAEEGTDTWCLNSIKKSDFILVIHSIGSYRHYLARKENLGFNENGSFPIRDIFIPAMINILDKNIHQHTNKKIIMAYFDHATSDCIPRELSRGLQYRLMKHFTELVLHIHGLCPGTDNLDDIKIPITGHHSATIEGCELLRACGEASKFEADNPEWFRCVYGYEKELLRYDSGFDSCSDGSHKNIPNIDDMGNQDKIRTYENEPRCFFPPDIRSVLSTDSVPLSEYMQRMNSNYEQTVNGLECISLGGESV